MDVSSGVAVHALELNPDDHVLDLCCAPGAKLCMIANLLASGTGTVTGVDISPHRAATCRSLVRRYKAGARARLFVADGTVFNVLAPRIAARRFAGGVEGTVRVEMEGEGYADGDVRVEVGVVRGRVEADSSTAISSTEHIRSSIPPSATSASSGPSSSTSSPSPSLSAVAPVKPFWAPKLLRFDPQLRGPGYLYDKVGDV
ncbi:hypothetical protein BC938DRAFT_474447 [Jimgerdemannia flammicorona]|uniref:SAM-dependent MTase RsmB/NOP-type domain-containing protein n=1 Tax=Jimgerdemannia flammicorona TaxID=994334 RepID=A0A433Q2J5_9FUNG|nr:hypothetical protein BC938DRAFT_474447 [Jimgerdemannia flammicorona]